MNISQVSVYDFINIGFAGAMLLVFFYALSIFFYDRKALYFYYALYILSVGLYLFSRSTFIYTNLTQELETYLPKVNSIVGCTFQYVAHFAALQFGIYFLKAKRNYPKFYKAAYYTRIVFCLVIFISLIHIMLIENEQFSFWLLNIERLFATIMAIYFQYILLKNSKNKLVVFYVVGSIIFLAGALTSVFALDVIYMRIGTLIEILLFALGLAYRSKIIQEERNLFKDKMMKETVEKEKLLNQYNEDLRNQVVERSEALLKEQQAVEEEKKKVLRLSLEKEIDQVKMTALRAQMKPHFLFNALNAIRAMIIKEDPHQAYDYLTDFSRLVRYILESSENNFVSLQEELKMIDIYIRIEQMRVTEEFEFNKKIGNDINMEELSVPPLIFQPFIENAIVHGFKKGKTGNTLKLEIYREADLLKIIVEDNGKGREQDKKEDLMVDRLEKKSMAIKLTKQRLNLLNANKTGFDIIDLKNEKNKAVGTKVVLSIPIIHYGKEAKGINS